MAMFTVSAVNFSFLWVFLLVLRSGKFIFYLLIDGTDKLITIIIIIIPLQPMLFSLQTSRSSLLWLSSRRHFTAKKDIHLILFFSLKCGKSLTTFLKRVFNPTHMS